MYDQWIPTKTCRVHNSLRSRNTLCLKKVPTFKLCVTLSNLNRFSKFLHCWKAYEICYKTHTHVVAHLTLGVLLQYLGKFKFLHMEENANKLHSNRL